jgi:uncharacterized protein (TIGR03118 family)
MKSTLLLASVALGLSFAASSAQAVVFDVTNLVSDGVVPAVTIDPDLKNPWGVSRSPTGPFWVSNAGTGTSTIYTGAGEKLGLTVTIPPPAGGSPPSEPTGQVFNGTSSFQIGGATPLFLFATEGGTIAGWAPSFGTNAVTAVDNSAADAGYTGLALGSTAGNDFLYAANFHAGTIEAYDESFASTLAGGFVDPNLGSDYAPFNVQLLDDQLYVAYAKQDQSGEEEVAGAGLGYVDVFTLDGTLVRRLVSEGDEVNAPWGLAIAPSSFGEFAGSLLVGNLGDGTISAFDRLNGDFLGKLRGRDGQPLAFEGLWALVPGNDGAAGSSQKIYFSAGLDDETRGLFGSLTAVPEPTAWLLMLAGFGLAGGMLRQRRRAAPAL